MRWIADQHARHDGDSGLRISAREICHSPLRRSHGEDEHPRLSVADQGEVCASIDEPFDPRIANG